MKLRGNSAARLDIYTSMSCVQFFSKGIAMMESVTASIIGAVIADLTICVYDVLTLTDMPPAGRHKSGIKSSSS